MKIKPVTHFLLGGKLVHMLHTLSNLTMRSWVPITKWQTQKIAPNEELMYVSIYHISSVQIYPHTGVHATTFTSTTLFYAKAWVDAGFNGSTSDSGIRYEKVAPHILRATFL